MYSLVPAGVSSCLFHGLPLSPYEASTGSIYCPSHDKSLAFSFSLSSSPDFSSSTQLGAPCPAGSPSDGIYNSSRPASSPWTPHLLPQASPLDSGSLEGKGDSFSQQSVLCPVAFVLDPSRACQAPVHCIHQTPGVICEAFQVASLKPSFG